MSKKKSSSKKKSGKKSAARRASSTETARIVMINSSKPKKKGGKKKAARKSSSKPAIQIVQLKGNSGKKKKKRRKNSAAGMGMKFLQATGGATAVIGVGYGVDQLNVDPKVQTGLAVAAEAAVVAGAAYAGAEPAAFAAYGAMLQQTTDRGRFLYARAQSDKKPANQPADAPKQMAGVTRHQIPQGMSVNQAAARAKGGAGL